jgi:hypothetical protein
MELLDFFKLPGAPVMANGAGTFDVWWFPELVRSLGMTALVGVVARRCVKSRRLSVYSIPGGLQVPELAGREVLQLFLDGLPLMLYVEWTRELPGLQERGKDTFVVDPALYRAAVDHLMELAERRRTWPRKAARTLPLVRVFGETGALLDAVKAHVRK